MTKLRCLWPHPDHYLDSLFCHASHKGRKEMLSQFWTPTPNFTSCFDQGRKKQTDRDRDTETGTIGNMVTFSIFHTFDHYFPCQMGDCYCRYRRGCQVPFRCVFYPDMAEAALTIAVPECQELGCYSRQPVCRTVQSFARLIVSSRLSLSANISLIALTARYLGGILTQTAFWDPCTNLLNLVSWGLY